MLWKWILEHYFSLEKNIADTQSTNKILTDELSSNRSQHSNQLKDGIHPKHEQLIAKYKKLTVSLKELKMNLVSTMMGAAQHTLNKICWMPASIVPNIPWESNPRSNYAKWAFCSTPLTKCIWVSIEKTGFLCPPLLFMKFIDKIFPL